MEYEKISCRALRILSVGGAEGMDARGTLRLLAKMVIAESEETGLPVETIVQGVFNAYTQGENTDAGTGKIAATVREIMAANVRAKDWYEKTAISASGIFKLTGCNQASIRKWLKDNAEMIEAHHTAMGIEDTTIHNRRAGQYRKKSVTSTRELREWMQGKI